MTEWPIRSIRVEREENGGFVVAIADAAGDRIPDPDNSSIWAADKPFAHQVAQVLADTFSVPIIWVAPEPVALCECSHPVVLHQTGDGAWAGFCYFDDDCKCEAPVLKEVAR